MKNATAMLLVMALFLASCGGSGSAVKTDSTKTTDTSAVVKDTVVVSKDSASVGTGLDSNTAKLK